MSRLEHYNEAPPTLRPGAVCCTAKLTARASSIESLANRSAQSVLSGYIQLALALLMVCRVDNVSPLEQLVERQIDID